MEKVDKRRPKNCVNIPTCRQISHECTNGPFKETYSETFWRRLILFERSKDGQTLPTETLVEILYRILQDFLGSYRILQDPTGSCKFTQDPTQDPKWHHVV